MLDINYIKKNTAKLKKVAEYKNIKIDLDKLISLDDQRKSLIVKIDSLRSERKKIGGGKDNIEKAKFIKKALNDLEPELTKVSEKFTEMSLHVPNIISDDTPIGKDESKNKVVLTYGKIKDFKFKLKSHIELGNDLDILDLERGVKTSGFRGYYLKNEGAILHLALIQYAMFKMIEKGFTPFITPTLVHSMPLVGSGHFPFGKEEVYQITNAKKLSSGEIDKDPYYLVGTAEPSLLSYYANETLDLDKLPIKFCGFSPCYRSEIGSYGKDTKGLFRLHEFLKVEQMVICKNDFKEADKWLMDLRKNSEEILRELGLPYRVLQICSGDMGAGKYKMFDIETYMAQSSAYRETHSDSNLTDWQTRRLNIKFKDSDGKKSYPFALNNTALATPRILIALLEYYQEKDGSIKIPKVLHKYTGFDVIKHK
jgi:seryl-tRNA synthetase